MSAGNFEQIKDILYYLWKIVKARDISSFLYSIDKTNNTKTLKAKRENGSLGDININIDDLASQSLDNIFDGENIFKDIYIKDTVLKYVDNKNANLYTNGEDQYSGVRELVVPANTYVSSIVIGLRNDSTVGEAVTGINVGTISTDNVVLEHLVTRGVGKVEENTYNLLSASKVVIVPINRSFGQDVYFMVGAKGMLWNSGTGYNVIGGNNMPGPGSRVSPNRSNYFGKVAIIGKGSSLKERLSDMARTTEFNNFTSTNNFKKILFEDGYLNTAILSTINNTRATTPSTGNNIYSASPSFRVQANTFVDKIIIGLGDDIEIGSEVIGVNIGTVGVDNNTVIEHLIVQGTMTAIANTYSEISCSKIISVPINRIFDKEVYFMVGAKGMLWNEARFAGVTAAGGENGMPSVGSRLSPNSTNYVGKILVIGQGVSIKESFENAISANNAINQATNVGGSEHANKLIKLSNDGKLNESVMPDELLKSNTENTFTKHNRFNDYSPTVHKVFTRKHINSNVTENPDGFEVNKYFAAVNEKYTEHNKVISHVLLPIKNARVGDSVSIDYFIFNNSGQVTSVASGARQYPVIDEQIAGCYCAKININTNSGTAGIGFGFMLFTHSIDGRQLQVACKRNVGNNNGWTRQYKPNVNDNLAHNTSINFTYKICYETTSELVTRFELENVTQMYPRNMIGEMKQLAYDCGDSFEDGMNTWLRVNGQAISKTEYPALFDKMNTSDDLEELQLLQVDDRVGYYYICVK